MPWYHISEMEVKVYPEMTKALQNNGTVRCLLRTRCTQYDGRLGAHIPWAEREATRVSRNLLQAAGLGDETATFTVGLKGYRITGPRHRAYICYDIFLEKCSRAARDRMEGSTRQPIHLISNVGKVFFAHRAPNYDKRVPGFLENDCADTCVIQPPNKATTQSPGNFTQDKLESIIQDVAAKIVGFIGGTLEGHIINQLKVQLHITKVMVSGPEENSNNATVKSKDPVAGKDAKYAIENTVTFLRESFRAQINADEFKSVLDHSAEKLEKSIKAEKDFGNGASEDGKSDVEEDEAHAG